MEEANHKKLETFYYNCKHQKENLVMEGTIMVGVPQQEP